MTGFADLFKSTEHDEPGIVAGKPAASSLYKQITPEGSSRRACRAARSRFRSVKSP